MSKFDYFVVFAEMRTGSNFLEANLNSFDGLVCHGEAFNPHFIGYPQSEQLLGITQKERDVNPQILIDRIKAADGLNGFRFFNNHDQRLLDICLADPRCAKIILTRNPVESFVSWKIASATGQWKLTDFSHAKTCQIEFDPSEFEDRLCVLQMFQVRLLNTLQKLGQTAFYVAYEDLQDVDVMNGLAGYLGCDNRIFRLDKSLKKQNPILMSKKVSNFPVMETSLVRLDQFNLTRTPNFEPRRGPMTPTYFVAPKSGLLYMPVKSGPVDAICDWMGRMDDLSAADVHTNFSQRELRQWKRKHEDHCSFTVLRHPLARAHAVFCKHILNTGKESFVEIRNTLRTVHGVPLPKNDDDNRYGLAAHRTAFLSWLEFLKANLAGQTALRVEGVWASQLTLLQGMMTFGVPDMILREHRLFGDLAMLASQLGRTSMPEPVSPTDPYAARLAEIYDQKIEQAARDACQRDYTAFGFGDWRQR